MIPSGRALVRLLAGASLVGALAAACTSQDPAAGTPGGSTAPFGSGPLCADGETSSCNVKVGEQGGVVSCYVGERVCAGGQWGACGDGTLLSKALAGDQLLALGPPTSCDNPCDPQCLAFEEVPSGGIGATSHDTFQWNSGGTAPAGLLDEPCDHADDCLGNTYCYHPKTSATCEHSKCAEGGPLDAACDPCVGDICDADPSCCDPQSSCSALYGTAPSYIDCGGDAGTCRMNIYNVNLSCTQICAAGGGACVDAWDNAGTCELDPTDQKSCDAVGSNSLICICDRPGGGAWDASCVEAVHTRCGGLCSDEVPTAEEAYCQPWNPGQTDPSCAGMDLTVGVPCDGSVPVCNVGTVPAPAGLTLAHFPAGAGQLPSCAPDLAAPGVATCKTTSAIAPGTCIDVKGCPNLTPGRELVINPAGSAGAVAECHPYSCTNNWSVYQGGACTPPACVGTKSTGSLLQLNMFITVDRSGSMGTNGMWTPAMNALKSFFRAPGSAGMNVAMRFFPDAAPADCSNLTCSGANCSQPLVPLGTLTVDAAPADAHEQSLVDAINSRSPAGTTPTYVALQGAIQWAVGQVGPGQQPAVVLITDGEPTHCNTSHSQIAALAQNAFNTHGILVYAIGLEGANETLVNDIALKGGTEAFFVANDSNVEQELLKAMQAIQGRQPSCTLEIPTNGPLDFAGTTLRYDAGEGEVVLPQVSDAGACGDGWYYDDPDDPARVVLCPSTCTSVQSNAVDVCNGVNEVFNPSTQHCYYRPTQTASGPGAAAACEAWGGTLASITSAQENAFLRTFVTSNTWIGLSDAATEGVFTWPTGEPYVYTNFASGEPNNQNNEDCIEMYGNGTWNDLACTTLRRYVCEAPIGAKQLTMDLTCPVTYEPTTRSEVYEATCPEGKSPQWGFMAYDTTVPSGALIAFLVRTAPSTTSLGTAPYSLLAVAQGPPFDTQVCSLFGPAPCPVDLYDRLGGPPSVSHGALELMTVLIPDPTSTTAPVVHDWFLSYTCIDNQ